MKFPQESTFKLLHTCAPLERRALFMQAIKTKFIYPLLQANLLIMMIVLCVSLWVLTEAASLRGPLMKLYAAQMPCPIGSMDDAEQNGQSSEIPVASYTPPPSKHGFPGLVSLATLKSVKSPY